MQTKNQFVRDLVPKDKVDSLFFVKYIAVMQARDGKSYLNLVLSDNSGDLESRSWQNAEKINDRIKKGTFVRAQGKVNLFQGRKQLILAEIEEVDGDDLDQSDFVLKTSKNPDEMLESLFAIVEELDDVYIKQLLKNVLSDPEINKRLKRWSAGKTIHHAYEGGLLEHILSVTTLARSLSAHYAVNANYVVAGAILHDLGKVYELTDGLNVEYTEEGKLVGHLVKGVELVDRFSYKIKNFPYDLKLHLKHVLLSHHGSYEYGSPKIPQTSEAFLVHLIDMMDSKMHALEMIKMTDNSPGHWSGFIKHLDRIIYKTQLPFYSAFITDEQVETRQTKSKLGTKADKRKHIPLPEPKTSMGNLLKGFKAPED